MFYGSQQKEHYLFPIYPRLGTLYYWLVKEQGVICKAVLYLPKMKQEIVDPRFFFSA